MLTTIDFSLFPHSKFSDLLKLQILVKLKEKISVVPTDFAQKADKEADFFFLAWFWAGFSTFCSIYTSLSKVSVQSPFTNHS